MQRKSVRAVLADLEPMKEEKALKVELDRSLEDTLDKILKNFRRSMTANSWRLQNSEEDYIYNSAMRLISLHTINQAHIDSFIFMLRDYRQEENFKKTAGIYLTAMVRVAYLQGSDSVSLALTLLEEKIDGFGKYLEARKNKPISISIIGNLGDYCLWECAYVNAKVAGNAGKLLGGFAQFSNIDVYGDVGEGCAYDAWESSFKIVGAADNSFGEWAKHTTLKCTNKDSVKFIRRRICEGSKVYWIDNNGVEKLVASTPPTPQINIDGQHTYESRKRKRAA